MFWQQSALELFYNDTSWPTTNQQVRGSSLGAGHRPCIPPRPITPSPLSSPHRHHDTTATTHTSKPPTPASHPHQQATHTSMPPTPARPDASASRSCCSVSCSKLPTPQPPVSHLVPQVLPCVLSSTRPLPDSSLDGYSRNSSSSSSSSSRRRRRRRRQHHVIAFVSASTPRGTPPRRND